MKNIRPGDIGFGFINDAGWNICIVLTKSKKYPLHYVYRYKRQGWNILDFSVDYIVDHIKEMI